MTLHNFLLELRLLPPHFWLGVVVGAFAIYLVGSVIRSTH